MEHEFDWLPEAKRIKLEEDRGQKEQKQNEEDERYRLLEQAVKEDERQQVLKEEDERHQAVVHNQRMKKLKALRIRHFEETLQLQKVQQDELIQHVVAQTLECRCP